ncbi:pre-peptidase C-terminal domain-containing protein [Pseudoalteromonas sp. T1lg65]|uniref:pre-peptidase C-terminal domain-containing protein n=1 Tax=Pseudoalteromonas sp. T1lg65 TaxID=2077101 RepID=UPI003F7AAC47
MNTRCHVTLSGAGALAIAATILSPLSHAGSSYHRLVWDTNPAHQATIGFTPNGGNNHEVRYGFSTDEQTWKSQLPQHTRVFDGQLTSNFVTLKDLPANSPVYYKVCDSQGCSNTFWFKTAPTDNSPFVVIAGGDTRTGWTNRQEGNKLVAKVRPLFIMHGGDYTNANSASEMKSYLSDWQLTFSTDEINGKAYQRIYPFIATHGNHEDDNYNTLCEVFGVDYNQDNQCNPHDTYGAFNISPLLRVYTLNSQFKNSGWSSYATAMNNWFDNDLSNHGNTAKWRIGQYHKPIFPHYSGKSDNDILYTWWADLFYANKMNLIVESDTHINKMTYPLVPNGSGFSANDNGGTVFVGEGSWGAPARSANDPKSWTIDLASIQQFKVITVEESGMQVRTAQFDPSAQALTHAQRAADPILLPDNVNWWNANGIGEALKLVQSTSGLSKIDKPTVPTPTPTELTSGEAVANLSAAKAQTLSFFITVPENTNTLRVNSANGSGDADLYVRHAQLPTQSEYDCRPYKEGNNESCAINSPVAGDYFIQLFGYGAFSGVTLLAENVTQDDNTTTYPNLSGSKGDWQYFSVEIPRGTQRLSISLTGGSGDADLYLRAGTKPTADDYDCRPYEDGNEESCTETNPAAGLWHIGIYAYRAYQEVTLTINHN